MIKYSTIYSLLLTLGSSAFLTAQHNNEFYNDGALVHIQAGAEVHVWGDVHNYKTTGDLENNGLLKVQGNMYSDDLFQQSGTGTTLIENSDVNTAERQFISGSYAVRGDQSQIGINDGSFYNLELNNSQGFVYLIRAAIAGNTPLVADVRGSVNFDPQALGIGSATSIVTHNIGQTGPISYPANGSSYGSEFGMMNPTAGLGNYINDTWHQMGNDNMSIQDKGYIIGKHRRAINPAGGIYGFLLGLDPGPAVVDNALQKGFQYIHFQFSANNYNVLTGYFEAGSPNNTAGPLLECNNFLIDNFWGADHGEWIFNDINNVTSGGTYEVKVWPQDPAIPFTGSVYTISKDDIYQYATAPLQNDCGPTAIGLDRNGFEDFSAFGVVSGSVFLGIDLLDLSAEAINNKYIQVEWSTAKEEDVDYFEIQRSTDDANFVSIQSTDAVGNSITEQNYSIDDYAVLPNVNYYYRIKSIDTDGTVDYTHSVVATINKEGAYDEINVYPNPISGDQVTIEVSSSIDKSSMITVYDAIGQLIEHKRIAINKGLNVFTLDTREWPDAVYYLHITNKEEAIIEELIKSKN